MTRHPATEGNELHPSDVIIPDPSGGDGRLSVRNDLAAEFAGLSISSTEPTDMPDGGVWVNLSAEPTGIDRIQTYDESSDAFIPISANDTVVSKEEPEPDIGLLWFEPVDDGANLYAASSDTWEFLQFIPAIPDSEIYLHDDWGDNSLTERDDSATTTHNDVEGVYRPEWRIESGNPEASDERLEFDTNEAIDAEINLNLDETITWEWSGIDFGTFESDSTIGVGFVVWAEDQNWDLDSSASSPDDAYVLQIRQEGDEVRLLNGDVLISHSTSPDESISLKREPNGDWELFVDGSTAGTANDTTLSDPQYIGFGGTDRGDCETFVDEVKVF